MNVVKRLALDDDAVIDNDLVRRLLVRLATALQSLQVALDRVDQVAAGRLAAQRRPPTLQLAHREREVERQVC